MSRDGSFLLWMYLVLRLLGRWHITRVITALGRYIAIIMYICAYLYIYTHAYMYICRGRSIPVLPYLGDEHAFASFFGLQQYQGFDT